MTIQVGDKIPACSVKTMGEQGPTDITTEDIFAGKKVVLFAVPGAFTPGCSITHLPGYVVNADKIKAAGVDSIVCMAVNDAFVMDAWGKAQNAEELIMLADGNGELTAALAIDPTLTRAWYNRGLMYLHAGDLDKAKQRIEQIQSASDDAEGFLGMYL